MEAAPAAIGYADVEDIGAVVVPRPRTAVGDGDRCSTSGPPPLPATPPTASASSDTAGASSSPVTPLGASGYGPVLPSARFTADLDLAMRSIVKLGGLTFETLLVGHGRPMAAAASAMVGELGASAG